MQFSKQFHTPPQLAARLRGKLGEILVKTRWQGDESVTLYAVKRINNERLLDQLGATQNSAKKLSVGIMEMLIASYSE